VSAPPLAHPIRLVVDDDLDRSRLTVFFRLILAIPHFLWLAVLGIVELVVIVINWFATLITGRSPQSLHDFLAGYLRYATHVNAYFWLAANPFPRFYIGSRLPPYPVDLEIDPPARQHRAKVGFRVILMIPAVILTFVFLGGGGTGSSRNSLNLGVTSTAAFLTWFAALVRARAPRGLRDISAWGLGYAAQTYGYLFILTDRYPYTGADLFLGGLEPPEVDERVPRLVNADDPRRSRLTVLFRLPLAIPHLVWLLGWTILALLAAVANWVAALAVGRSPRPLARFLSAYVRYSTHVGAFLHVIGNPFPGFVGTPGRYPLDPMIRPFEPQDRWITLFRIVLAIPALIVASALSGVLFAAAVFGWFVSLARAQMPAGLQSAGAYALGYSAQLSSYALVLTDRYPHASPAAVLAEETPAAEPPAALPTGEALD
jgi:Domain of unknown function (DUF4389)